MIAYGTKVVTQDSTTRIVEAAIPWTEIPDVHARMKAGQLVKFSFRVNDNAGVGRVPAGGWELSRGRSVAKRGASCHVDWIEHGENQVQFGWRR